MGESERSPEARVDIHSLPDVYGELGKPADLGEFLYRELERLRLDPMKYGHACHAMQEEFICSRSRRRIVVAANRTGKTEGAMRDILWTARGNHPYRRTRLCDQIWVGAPDYPSYLRFHKPMFDQWCPPAWIKGSFHDSEKWVDIRRVDGGKCRIFFLSYDMPRTKWQGAGVDAIWLDEESPEDIYKECMARIVTTKGWILLTFTPVSGIGWWHDRIFQPAIEGLNYWDAFTMPLATRDEGNDDDFEVGESLVPHLTREEIIDFASNYPDPEERAIRVFGEVKGRQGLVYKQFRRRIHLIPRFEVPAHMELWGGLDPGYHGFAAVVATIDSASRLYIVGEYFSQAQTTRERFRGLLKEVRRTRSAAEWNQAPATTVVFFVDTEDPQVVLELNTQAAEATAEQDSMDEFDEYGDKYPEIRLAFVSLAQGLKARKAGFLRVQQQLAIRKNRGKPTLVDRGPSPVGEPMMYFFDDLHSEWQEEDGRFSESRVVWEIEHYSWKKPPAGSMVRPDDADENSARGAHAMAAFRYLTMARLGPSPDEDADDDKQHLSQADREIWEAVEELEERIQQESAGY